LNECSIMNAAKDLCSSGGTAQWRCRLLEPHDIAGLIRLYGGIAPSARQPPLCDRDPSTIPESPVFLGLETATPPGVNVQIHIRNPSAAGFYSLAAARANGSCPMRWTAVDPTLEYTGSSDPGGEATFSDVATLPSGSYCWSIWAYYSTGKYSRPINV